MPLSRSLMIQKREKKGGGEWEKAFDLQSTELLVFTRIDFVDAFRERVLKFLFQFCFVLLSI